ncbi:hypothetical protein [Afipia felis]|uniref:Uncharacterized protein n=2 Tax=Afipia felis TaxID=1035 RepID=A0A380WAQ5_AFIFE|nr:hypothetical protein [Afipia felis]EKS28966.1 hypothetical protein HMPREF9697_01494 [Afipia felis ATCC 53690]SUU77674.1 Uncharacterised protein [Afipia felis]SUU85739.1 Uncharacterised protein [Afipia felis]
MTLSRTTTSTNPPDAAQAARRQLLKDNNINPRTGLATDYLNHFNEAIMLLEMIPDMPECTEDFLSWRPLTYRQHFEASNLKAKELAIQAYEQADLALKTEFDRVIGSMRDILVAVSEGMRRTKQDATRIKLATEAIGWIQPLLAMAGALIHGVPDGTDIDSIMEA